MPGELSTQDLVEWDMSECNSEIIIDKDAADIHLRSVDLNLLTVFDAVMQMQNITRAAAFFGNVTTGSQQCGRAVEIDV